MEHHMLENKGSVISYYRFGNGPKTALCFHGYGEDAATFRFLGEKAGHQYSFFCIDLPFHGKSSMEMDPPFTVKELQEIISRITADPSEKLTLVGFSLGARVALALYELMPARVERLVLLAPDGLKVNGWYWLATQTWLGNRFFSFTMRYPGWFKGLLALFNKTKLLNPSIFKFVKHYIGDAKIRRLLYQRWTSLRKIRPNINAIKSAIKFNKTDVRLIYGRHDRIILSSVGEKFQEGIEPWCTLYLIASGHQVLHEKHAGEIIFALS